jgi:hypothetical protein
MAWMLLYVQEAFCFGLPLLIKAMKIRIPLLALSLGLTANVAEAQYINRGNGMIYDPTRNLTWIADMNLALTTNYTAPGVWPNKAMSWGAAVQFADNLVYGGFSDWRLPTLNLNDPTCSDTILFGAVPVTQGSGCTGGELSGLFGTGLGNQPWSSVLDQVGDTPDQLANFALFTDVKQGHYWASNSTPFGGLTYVWQYSTFWGTVWADSKEYSAISGGRVVLVRDGDVMAVPEPSTSALIAAGLAGLLAVGRRRRADA